MRGSPATLVYFIRQFLIHHFFHFILDYSDTDMEREQKTTCITIRDIVCEQLLRYIR